MVVTPRNKTTVLFIFYTIEQHIPYFCADRMCGSVFHIACRNHLHDVQIYIGMPALASPRRTARYERISPDGFDMAALEVTLYGGTPPPPNGGSPPLSGEAILPKNKPAPTEVPVGAGFAASEQFHLFRYSRFTFSYACSLPRLPLPVQCLPE